MTKKQVLWTIIATLVTLFVAIISHTEAQGDFLKVVITGAIITMCLYATWDLYFSGIGTLLKKIFIKKEP